MDPPNREEATVFHVRKQIVKRARYRLRRNTNNLQIRRKALGGYGPDPVSQRIGRIPGMYHDQLVQLEVAQGVAH